LYIAHLAYQLSGTFDLLKVGKALPIGVKLTVSLAVETAAIAFKIGKARVTRPLIFDKDTVGELRGGHTKSGLTTPFILGKARG
jgi:hypothetical protein